MAGEDYESPPTNEGEYTPNNSSGAVTEGDAEVQPNGSSSPEYGEYGSNLEGLSNSVRDLASVGRGFDKKALTDRFLDKLE
jgi:hypothetical protein